MSEHGKAGKPTNDNRGGSPSALELPNYASAYYGPQAPPRVSAHRTLEIDAVRLHPAIDPKSSPTRRLEPVRLASPGKQVRLWAFWVCVASMVGLSAMLLVTGRRPRIGVIPSNADSTLSIEEVPRRPLTATAPPIESAVVLFGSGVAAERHSEVVRREVTGASERPVKAALPAGDASHRHPPVASVSSSKSALAEKPSTSAFAPPASSIPAKAWISAESPKPWFR